MFKIEIKEISYKFSFAICFGIFGSLGLLLLQALLGKSASFGGIFAYF